MAFTLQQLDQKIREAQTRLDYWNNLREMVSNPLFSELETSSNGQGTVAREPLPLLSAESTPPLEYGALRKRTLAALPTEGHGITTNELAELLTSQGYVFKSKWPSISVNDTLRALEEAKQARRVGKNSSNGILWLRRAESDVSADSGS